MMCWMNLLASRVNTKRAEPKTTSMSLLKDIEGGLSSRKKLKTEERAQRRTATSAS